MADSCLLKDGALRWNFVVVLESPVSSTGVSDESGVPLGIRLAPPPTAFASTIMVILATPAAAGAESAAATVDAAASVVRIAGAVDCPGDANCEGFCSGVGDESGCVAIVPAEASVFA